MFTVSSDNIGIKTAVTTSYFAVHSTWVHEIIYNNVELCYIILTLFPVFCNILLHILDVMDYF